MSTHQTNPESPSHLAASMAEACRFYPAPGNLRAYLQQPCDDTIVEARPDLKFQLHRAIDDGAQLLRAIGDGALYKTGFGFALRAGESWTSFDYDRVEQRFEMGCVPILSQRITQAGFQFNLESFTTSDPQGRGVVMLRMTIWRRQASPESIDLAFLATRAGQADFMTHGNPDYIAFEPWGAAWEKPQRWQMEDATIEDAAIHDGAYIFATSRFTSGVTAQPGDGRSAVACVYRVAPRRDQPETLEFLVPYECVAQPATAGDLGLDFRAERAFPLAQKGRLQALSFGDERERQRRAWLAHLGRGTHIQVPDAEVQELHRTLTLNCLQFLGRSPDEPACKPGQGGFNNFSTVYAWEASHYLVMMARQGYFSEVGRALDYLITTQQGVGPDGDSTDADGCFRPYIFWMNETGAVLHIFAEYALSSGDHARLRKDAPALLKAARWIQRQRNSTRDLLPDGSPALHYGLLPKGRPHDWPIRGHFVFSDAHTWRGLDCLAKAFAAADLPDADWLRTEADEYRQCILTAVGRSLKPHPLDPALTWFPCDIYEDPAEAIKTTIFCGPLSLIASGILDAAHEWVPLIEASLRAAGCLNDHFAFRMRLMEDEVLRQRHLVEAGGHVDLYYVTLAEIPWHRMWLERGELDKAWSYFYMTLAYSVSRDLHMAQERYCPQLPWMLPWQPNASANGRILSMILSSLCFVRDDVCHLLQGAPDAWFAAGAPLGLDGLRMNGGTFSFRLERRTGEAGWKLSYTCSGSWMPKVLRLALPGADGQRMQKEIALNGKREGSINL